MMLTKPKPKAEPVPPATQAKAPGSDTTGSGSGSGSVPAAPGLSDERRGAPVQKQPQKLRDLLHGPNVALVERLIREDRVKEVMLVAVHE